MGRWELARKKATAPLRVSRAQDVMLPVELEHTSLPAAGACERHAVTAPSSWWEVLIGDTADLGHAHRAYKGMSSEGTSHMAWSYIIHGMATRMEVMRFVRWWVV